MSLQNASLARCPSVPHRTPVAQLRLWILLLPMLFLAVHGQPSFMQGNRNIEGGTGLSAAVGSFDAPGSGTFERAFVYAAYGIVFALCLRSGRRIRSIFPFAVPLLLLAVLALCSTVWSQQPVNSLRYAVYYTMDTLLALCLLATFTLQEIMSLAMMTGMLVALCSVLTVVLFPQYGVVHLVDHAGVWQGIFSEKNDAAKNMVFLLTPVVGRQISQWKNLAYAALMLPLILMTGSKSAVVALLVLVAFALAESVFARLSRRSASFLLLVIGLVALLAAALFFIVGAQITALLGRDATLTGRTDIWNLLVESALRRPWFGYGYSAFWTGLDGESGKIYETLHWIFTYAHNGLLEVWLQLGFAGLAVVFYTLAKTLRSALLVSGRTASPGVQWLVHLFVLTIVYNLDEGTILFTRSLVSMLFVLTCVGLARAAALKLPAPLRLAVHRSIAFQEQPAHA